MYIYIYINIHVYMYTCVQKFIFTLVLYMCVHWCMQGVLTCAYGGHRQTRYLPFTFYILFSRQSLWLTSEPPHLGQIWRPSNSAFLTNSTPHAQTQASGLQVHATTPVFYINVSSGNLNSGRFLLQQPLHSSISPDPNRVFF